MPVRLLSMMLFWMINPVVDWARMPLRLPVIFEFWIVPVPPPVPNAMPLLFKFGLFESTGLFPARVMVNPLIRTPEH